MTYQLGIDLGTTSVAAAIHRADAQDPEVVPLGGTGATVPAVLHLARDGGVTVGDGAARRAGLDPGRVVRALKRRVGDPTPVVVGRESWTAEELSARMVRWVVDRVVEREGAAPAAVALACPPSWSAATLDRLARALTGQDVAVTFVPEPVAMARAARPEPADGAPETVAVYDLGGGRLDTSVLRRGDGDGFALLGHPEGLTDVGGLEFDDLLWEHVRPGLPADVLLDARVRRAVVRAKESLSAKSEAVVRVRQGDRVGEVRVDRATFEQLITPTVDRTVVTLQRVVASAELAAADLDAILLVGGSSRIPLVARTVSVRLGRPVTVIDGARHLVACGAALMAAASPGPAGCTAGIERLQGGTADISPEPLAAPTPAPAVTAPHDAAAEGSTLQPPAAEPVVEPVAAPAPEADAPTVTLAVPLSVDAATTPRGTPAVTPTVVPPVPAPADPLPAAPRPATRTVRTPAVLEPGSRRGSRTRSLPRLLVGAGAVVVAALVLVALFRPDGPLDPPLDPAGSDTARITGAPAVPAAVPTAPAVEGVRDGDQNVEGLRDDPAGGVSVDGAANGVRVEDAAAALVAEPARPRTSGDRRAVPTDAGGSAVDTTPPPAPTVRTTGVGPVPRLASDQSDVPPVGAAPRTPPTPAAPLT